ncbi:hypothetical protein B0I35DRAFT_417432 [Stachybotrys elegans]|uniref:Uncharacterized protein n=1 Tax=Stachybotrys elegans TaxID=80388 RepID=A0A8K0WWR0_9HYPO|nr:hypothetical protein B0I35DRAFT_417432 [Stachybotrys elegans]
MPVPSSAGDLLRKRAQNRIAQRRHRKAAADRPAKGKEWKLSAWMLTSYTLSCPS